MGLSHQDDASPGVTRGAGGVDKAGADTVAAGFALADTLFVLFGALKLAFWPGALDFNLDLDFTADAFSVSSFSFSLSPEGGSSPSSSDRAIAS